MTDATWGQRVRYTAKAHGPYTGHADMVLVGRAGHVRALPPPACAVVQFDATPGRPDGMSKTCRLEDLEAVP